MYGSQDTGLPCITEGATDKAVFDASGSTGIVSEVQRKLLSYYKNRALSHLPEPVVDGVLSPANRSLIAMYQQEYGLDVDGIIGPQTYQRLGFSENALPCGTMTIYQDYSTALSQMQSLESKEGFFSKVRKPVLTAALLYAIYYAHKNREMIAARIYAMTS